jgi:hypothetical protein
MAVEQPRFKHRALNRTHPPFVSSEVETRGVQPTSLDFARDERDWFRIDAGPLNQSAGGSVIIAVKLAWAATFPSTSARPVNFDAEGLF